jgi:hypothetical protein
LKQWCEDKDNHPEQLDSSNCALIYALVPFKPNGKKDGLDSIWNQQHFYGRFEHEVETHVIDEFLFIFSLILIGFGYFLRF